MQTPCSLSLELYIIYPPGIYVLFQITINLNNPTTSYRRHHAKFKYIIKILLISYFSNSINGLRADFSDSKMRESYNLLGLSQDATVNEIKHAFNEKALTCHPDKGGNEEDFLQVRNAYEAITESIAYKKSKQSLKENTKQENSDTTKDSILIKYA